MYVSHRKVESKRTQGDIKRRIDCQEEDLVIDDNISFKWNQINTVKLFSDDKANIILYTSKFIFYTSCISACGGTTSH